MLILYSKFCDEYFRKQETDLQLHSARVAHLGFYFSLYLGMGDRNAFNCQIAGLFHDIGKIYIPIKILNKPSILTENEFDIVKYHPEYSSSILKFEGFSKDIYSIVRHHHENFDGSGYPAALIGDQIPIGARILRIIDVFDALTNDRPYRKAITIDEALNIICSDKRCFDSELLMAFIEWIRKA